VETGKWNVSQASRASKRLGCLCLPAPAPRTYRATGDGTGTRFG